MIMPVNRPPYLHQSEHMFIGASMPVLSPCQCARGAGFGESMVGELSRYSGLLGSLKAITEKYGLCYFCGYDPNRTDHYS